VNVLSVLRLPRAFGSSSYPPLAKIFHALLDASWTIRGARSTNNHYLDIDQGRLARIFHEEDSRTADAPAERC